MIHVAIMPSKNSKPIPIFFRMAKDFSRNGTSKATNAIINPV